MFVVMKLTMLKTCVKFIAGNVRSANTYSALLVHRPIVDTFECITNKHFTSTATILEFGKFKHHYSASLPQQQVRNYAKGKDKKKEKGKVKVQVNEVELAEIINVDTLRNQMEKAINTLKNDYVKHLSLRSTTGSIEAISVNLDGKDHTLQELAQIVRKNPKVIVVNMAIFPQAIPAAIKAIDKSGMNLNPQQDGTTLYIPVPTVTKEHRENLAKNAKTLFIKCKDCIRDVQNKHSKTLKKKEGISIDTVRNVEQQVLTIADTYISEAEKIMESKQHELVGKD